MTSITPFTDEEEPFAGPVWIHSERRYNECFDYEPELKQFVLGRRARKDPLRDIVHDNMDALVELQKATGRLGFVDVNDHVRSFTSGFFVSPKHFFTVAHNLTDGGELKSVASKEHLITVRAGADIRTVEIEGAWFPATLCRFDLVLDVALYELVKDTVSNYFPIPICSPALELNQMLVSIVYNGAVSSDVLKKWVEELPAEERPVITLTHATASEFLKTERKSVSPGHIVTIEKDKVGVSASLSPGASGGPVFIIPANSKPVLIGYVTAGKKPHNYNIISLFTAERFASLFPDK